MDPSTSFRFDSVDASTQTESPEDQSPKLAIFSSQWAFPEPQGVKTPPLRAPVSVPFKWEEAPGRPKTKPDVEIVSSRCLNLPPRLLGLADDNQSNPGRAFESPHFHSKLARVPSQKRRPEFDSPARQKAPGQVPQRGVRQSFEGSRGEAEFESPRSILIGPNARSRGSSSSSQDSASVLADTCALIMASQDDEAAPQLCGLPPQVAREKSPNAAERRRRSGARNIRGLAGLWSRGLSRIKHGKKKLFAESERWAPTCRLPYGDVAIAPGSSSFRDESISEMTRKKNDGGIGDRAAAECGLKGGSLPPVFSLCRSPATRSPAKCRRGNAIKRRKRKWVFGKLRKSSTFFAAIWRRASRAVSAKRKKVSKRSKPQQLNCYHTLSNPKRMTEYIRAEV